MESNKIEKEESSIDLKNMGIYLISKWWLIVGVTVLAIVGALLYTKLFITPAYSSTSEIFIINMAGDSTTASASDWSIGKQLSKTAPKLITLDFCEEVANTLNNNPEFTEKFKDVLPDGKISAIDIYRGTSVSSDDESSTITFVVVNANNELAAVIVNAIAKNFGEFAQKIIGSDTISTTITLSGRIAKNPYNIHTVRNIALSGAVAFAIVCVALIIIFIFNDKIRTPDDIERHLKLSVLGTIPNFENKKNDKE